MISLNESNKAIRFWGKTCGLIRAYWTAYGLSTYPTRVTWELGVPLVLVPPAPAERVPLAAGCWLALAPPRAPSPEEARPHDPHPHRSHQPPAAAAALLHRGAHELAVERRATTAAVWLRGFKKFKTQSPPPPRAHWGGGLGLNRLGANGLFSGIETAAATTTATTTHKTQTPPAAGATCFPRQVSAGHMPPYHC
jgi:hypothetical protein